jgi:hypothetical protein
VHRKTQAQRKADCVWAGHTWADTDLVFANALGAGMLRENVAKRLDKLMAKAGLGHLSLTQIGRHTNVSLQLADPANEATARELAAQYGTSVAMIDRTYGHRMDREISVHVGTMNRLFGTSVNE